MKHRSSMSKKERALRSKIAKLVHDYPFIEGGLVQMVRTCGKNGCKCTKGEKHISWYLATKYEGKRKMIYIPSGMEKKVLAWGKTYKEIRNLMKSISDKYLEDLIKAKNPEKEKMLRRFCGYIVKVFDFDKHIVEVSDAREKPDIKTSTIWMSGLLMCALRLGSLNAMETELCIPRRMEKLLGKRKTSADSIGRVYALMELESLRNILSRINHQLKRNKALRTDWPFRFVAIDGHELFSSRSRCCCKCSTRTITVNGEKITEYYHRVVVCHLLGFKLPLPLDVEPVLPGEGEVTAAKRLLERVLDKYPRFFDVVVGDALYMEAPFINLCLSYGKHTITVLKEEQLILMQDAKGIFKMIEPRVFTEDKKTVKVWDAEGFTTAGTDKPLRVVYAQETERKRRRIKGEWVEEISRHEWSWASTIPERELSVRRLWKAGHRRWDIENNLFNVLVNHWHMNHCYKHEPNAIIAFLLTLFIAFILVQSFYHLNLKKPMRDRFSIIAVTLQLYGSLGENNFIAPWLMGLPVPP